MVPERSNCCNFEDNNCYLMFISEAANSKPTETNLALSVKHSINWNNLLPLAAWFCSAKEMCQFVHLKVIQKWERQLSWSNTRTFTWTVGIWMVELSITLTCQHSMTNQSEVFIAGKCHAIPTGNCITRWDLGSSYNLLCIWTKCIWNEKITFSSYLIVSVGWEAYNFGQMWVGRVNVRLKVWIGSGVVDLTQEKIDWRWLFPLVQQDVWHSLPLGFTETGDTGW